MTLADIEETEKHIRLRLAQEAQPLITITAPTLLALCACLQSALQSKIDYAIMLENRVGKP